mgnify:CR=1 FL=1
MRVGIIIDMDKFGLDLARKLGEMSIKQAKFLGRTILAFQANFPRTNSGSIEIDLELKDGE